MGVSTQLATSLKFSIESWPNWWRDSEALRPLHWQELALNKDQIALDVDEERFRVIDEQGLLHILTVRDGSRMVGYFIAIVMPHLHYKSAGLMAFVDMFYILREYRVGGTGAKLFAEAERTLKGKGVVKIYSSCKVHADLSLFYKALGYQPSDLTFIKMI